MALHQKLLSKVKTFVTSACAYQTGYNRSGDTRLK